MNFSKRPSAMLLPKVSLSRPWTLAALALGLVLPLLGGGSAHASGKAAPIGGVAVANFTTFNDADLSFYLAKTLSPELRQVIRERKLSVVARTATFDTVGACFASVGLAEMAPAGRSPRQPAFTLDSYRTSAVQDFDGAACSVAVLESAVATLNDTSIAKVLGGIEKTALTGGSRESELVANPKTARIASNIGQTYDDSPLFDQLHNFRIGEAVAHRYVATSVWSRSTRLDSGRLMCVAQAGFTARPPQERNFRLPTIWQNFVSLQDEGSLADCEQQAAIGAVRNLMKEPWVGKGGSMTNIARTREDGIPLPDLKRVAAVENQLVAETQARQQVVASRNTQTNRVSCTNQCSNGACLRTFSDGRQERWQAPRVYNSFKQDWEWNTSSCGG